MTDKQRFPRPRPVIGDTSSAQERRENPAGWAMGDDIREALADVVAGRRDIRRYRPDPVPEHLLRQVLEAGHRAPSVGHSQPWRFIVITDQGMRDRAAHMADVKRLEQAENLTSDRAARLLDLKLEGLREAPIGVVVACDRRTPSAGVLGRATFTDADLWSCACAIENMWLTARALGLGMGWVTLFEPCDLANLVGLPDGVESLGWLCLGWPDERPPAPGLERAAWSRRMPLDDVIMHNGWSEEAQAPVSHLRGPVPEALVTATDEADELLSPPESLGVLDRAISRVVAVGGENLLGGTLVLACADHPVARLGVTAFPQSVTGSVMDASSDGGSLGARAAAGAGLGMRVIDAGVGEAEASSRGDLLHGPAMTGRAVAQYLDLGREIGADVAAGGLVVLGEVGVGNTTVAAALTCALFDVPTEEISQVVGIGAGADADIVARKRDVVTGALRRVRSTHGTVAGLRPATLLAELGGPEIAVLTGVVLGAAEAGAPVVLDGLATSVAGLIATRMEPACQAYLIGGQRSREGAHGTVLRALGLEPLLDLRLRAGEGVGGCLAASLLIQGLEVRRTAARTL